MDRPRRKRNEGSSFRLGSTAPCFPLLAGLVAVVKQAKKANDGRPRHEQKKIGPSNPPRLTEARHDGTEESGKRKSTNTIERTRTGAKLGSETIFYSFVFMYSCPPDCSPLRLPRGEIVVYNTGRPSIRLLIQKIAALGYEVSGFPIQQTDLRQLPPGVWHCAVVLGEIILFVVAPAATSASDSSSVQSGQSIEGSPFYDEENVDPDNPGGGYGYWHR